MPQIVILNFQNNRAEFTKTSSLAIYTYLYQKIFRLRHYQKNHRRSVHFMYRYGFFYFRNQNF
eukprot:UN25318